VDGKLCIQNKIKLVDLSDGISYCIHIDCDNGYFSKLESRKQ